MSDEPAAGGENGLAAADEPAAGASLIRTRRGSAELEAAIVTATLELVGERGYAGLGVDAVAERAGVARSVLYRRWPDKAQLVAAALDHAQTGLVPDHGSGDLHTDLRTVLRNVADLLAGPLGAACAVLHAERSAKPDVREAAARTGLGTRRRAIAQVLERAVATGELRPGVMTSQAPHAGTALLLFHHLEHERPVDHPLADAVLDDVVWPAVERWAVGAGPPAATDGTPRRLRHMDDTQIAAEVEQLETEERKLRHEEEQAAEAGRGDVLAADRTRLEEIRPRLAQLADLQRQRTALRNAGGDPADAQLRDAKTIEEYRG